MALLEQLRSDGAVSLSTAQWAVLVGVLVVAVSLLAAGLGPRDQVGPVNPVAEWTWNETADGDVALAHEGGDSIDRDSLRLVGDALSGTATNLGDGDDARIVQPFEDDVVSRGDSLVIDGDALEDGSVALRWHAPDSDQSATLAYLDYPGGLEAENRNTSWGSGRDEG